MSNGLSIYPNATITLVGGALAKNVFWLAAGIPMYDNTSVVGTFIASSGIGIYPNTTINGGLFALGPIVPVVIAAPLKAPSLNSLTNLTIFTSAGSVYNTGVTTITGLVGANSGTVTGFNAPVIATSTMDATAVTDLASLVSNLNAITNTPTALPLALTAPIAAGIYTVTGNASIPGNLVLSGSATDIFIIKVSGKFTMSANATVTLSGGVKPDNVFWQVQGDVLLQANTAIAGKMW